MNSKNESDRCGGNDHPQEKPSDSDFIPATSNQTLQRLPELGSQFNRVEESFSAIASQHKLPHRRLLALNWAARFHGIPTGTFQKAFEMWMESNIEGGQR